MVAVLDWMRSIERSDETLLAGEVDATVKYFPFNLVRLTRREHGVDISRWAVWLGRHRLEKISSLTKGELKRDRTPP